MNAQIAAQAFFGTLFAFAINQGLLTDASAAQIPPEVVVEQFIDIFVQGTIGPRVENEGS